MASGHYDNLGIFKTTSPFNMGKGEREGKRGRKGRKKGKEGREGRREGRDTALYLVSA